jgi:hypothetical protein
LRGFNRRNPCNSRRKIKPGRPSQQFNIELANGRFAIILRSLRRGVGTLTMKEEI